MPLPIGPKPGFSDVDRLFGDDKDEASQKLDSLADMVHDFHKEQADTSAETGNDKNPGGITASGLPGLTGINPTADQAKYLTAQNFDGLFAAAAALGGPDKDDSIAGMVHDMRKSDEDTVRRAISQFKTKGLEAAADSDEAEPLEPDED
jgi:hypothetical protein